MRTVSFDIPPHEILTKDSVTIAVDAVVYYRIADSSASVQNVENASHSTRLLAQVTFFVKIASGRYLKWFQTTLRTMLGTRTLSGILSDREEISSEMLEVLDKATDEWGIKVFI